ncbi:hypothetical protein F511_13885 [Dorcoceras hygrometricum]|uniref:Uncharacterized protein n=1 Tax=Dorcoceras hygrometricum TaxID=472368 RepID=A0A2Z7C5R2_9LAMI|nr:hypothetical protein F511_13885 [Dorcoceras hygrometricum]
MVKMFRSLEESGLRGFLGVSGSVFEGALIEFFTNASVIVGTIVSTISKRWMVITSDVFVEMFQLLTEGMVIFSDPPAKAVVEMKVLFSSTGVPFRTPNKKKDMKKNRMKRTKPVNPTVDDQAESSPAPNPDIAAAAEGVSTSGAQEKDVGRHVSDGFSVFAPVEIRKGALPAGYSGHTGQGGTQIHLFDKWCRFRTGYMLNKITSMKLVEEFAKIEDLLLPWAETKKVNELLQRRELIRYKMVEQRMCKVVAEH